jgi:putative aldouronate transport system substrate-binding protein
MTVHINDGKDVPEAVDRILYTREEEDSIREIRATIDSFRAESKALFITGAMCLDRDWARYLAELERMGLRRYLEVAQRAYTRTVNM